MSPAEILAAHLAYDPALLTREAATYVGVHPKTLLDLARDGKVGHIQSKDGGRFRFRLSALNAYLESLESKPRQAAPQEVDWGL